MFGEVIDKGRHRLCRRYARRAEKPTPKNNTRPTATPSMQPTKSKAFSLPASTPSGATRRQANSSTSIPGATITLCPAIRCGRLSTRRRKCSGPWASRMKRTIPRLRPRSSRSTTAMPKRLPPPTRSSSTSCICRQVANENGHDRQLPAQARSGRQRQRHAHQRARSARGKTNLFWDAKGEEKLSNFGWTSSDRILDRAAMTFA